MPSQFGKHSTNASALVIVLLFVTLLTFVAVAFLVRSLQSSRLTDSSVSQAKAEELAHASINHLVGELQQEIASGSTVKPDPLPAGAPGIYRPLTRAGWTPAIAYSNGGSEPPVNVIKRSARQVPFFADSNAGDYDSNQPATDWASASSTEDRSANGRAVPKTRWNLPRLIDNGAEFANFEAPDWVIVTRDGPEAFTAWDPALKDNALDNGDYAVGRFAYVIYDEGGLLDINVAGNRLTAAQNGERGRLHGADLSQIPNLSDPAALIDWRSAFSGDDDSAQPREGGLFDPFRDFSEVQTRAGGSDRTFLSRQDLIDYAETHPSVFDPNLKALQYLGTFSRELNRPAFTPNTPAGSSITYPNTNNPDLAALRFTRAGTLADGTAVAVNTPFFQKRFSLGRLAWITARGPSANLPPTDPAYNPDGTTENIQRYFGLARAEDGYTWDYTGPDGTALANSVDTLDVAADTPREATFFELLKAVILQGALGQYYNDTSSNTGVRDENIDVHALQIGANLIDQSDRDDFPFIINFDLPGVEANIFGVENLPSIHNVSFLPYRPVGNINQGVSGRNNLGGWFFPRLWNVHQNATDADTSIPLRFVAMSGDVDFRTWYGGNSPTGSGIGYGTTPFRSLTRFDPAIHRVTFSNDPIFEDPSKVVSSLVDPSKTQLNAVLDERSPAMTLESKPKSTPDQVPEGELYDFAGIIVEPITTAVDKRLEPTALKYFRFTRIFLDSRVSFELQFSPDGGATFYPYQRRELTIGVGGQYDGANQAFHSRFDGGSNQAAPGVYSPAYSQSGFRIGDIKVTSTMESLRAIDPRSPRLGFAAKPDATNDLSDWFGPNLSESYDPPEKYVQNPLRMGYIMPGGGRFVPSAQTNAKSGVRTGLYSVNDPSLNLGSPPTTYYRDRDNIVRRGDGDHENDVHPTFSLTEPKSGSDLERRDDRPLILNRPLRSVGEMGYAFRDSPWKTLDLFSEDSGDAGLLDVFSLDDQTVVSGKINLNTRQPSVLKSLLVGTRKSELDAMSAISPAFAGEIANWMVSRTGDPNEGPLTNRSESSRPASSARRIFRSRTTATTSSPAGRPSSARSPRPARRARGIYSSTRSRRPANFQAALPVWISFWSKESAATGCTSRLTD